MAFREIQNLNADKVIRIDDSGSDGSLESISGYYLGYKEIPSSLNPTEKTKIHVFSIEGNNIGVWGKKIMNTKLAAVPAPSNPQNLSDGRAFFTTVTFAGLRPATKKGFKPAYNYVVGFDDENVIKVDAALESSVSTGDEDNDVDNVEETVVARTPFTAQAATKDHAAAITKLLNKTRK